MTEQSSERWYALYVRSNFERAAEQCLRGKGYQAFSPFYQTWRKRSDRTKRLDLPLFPGYVFCSFNANKRLPILTTPGVVTIVGGATFPSRLIFRKSIQFNWLRSQVVPSTRGRF